MIEKDFLTEIENAAKSLGISPATLCVRSVGNSRLPQRLRNGQSVTLATIQKLRAYLSAHSKQVLA